MIKNICDGKQYRKRSYHRTGIFILRDACEECPFHEFSKKKDGVSVCINPYVGYYTYESHNVIVKCADSYKPKKCEYYRFMKNHLEDIEFAKQIIDRKAVKGWLPLSKKIIKKMMKKMPIKSEGYIIKLFTYFGYIVVKDERVNAKILLTNQDLFKE